MDKLLIELPKVELHLHLEGAIPLVALWELIQKYDGSRTVKSIDELTARFKYKDFPGFIDTWIWKNNFLREYEDFTFLAEAVAKDLSEQNIVYVEAFYSPGDFARHGLEPQLLTQAIRKGLNKHSDSITINLVADLIRDFGPEKGMLCLEQVAEVKSEGVIGIGIGGSEQHFPPAPYSKVYDRARELGFYTSAHAGEAAGPESIWSAINSLKVNRIGHGTRAIEDEKLVDYLRDQQIPIEMCPISNLKTGVTPSIEGHPVKTFFDNGLLVTVNTDDPKMFNNSLVQEYDALINNLGFRYEEIVQLISNAIKSAWCSDKKKTELTNSLGNFVNSQ